MPQQQAAQMAANEAARERLNAFSDGSGHAKALLIKRDAFLHEAEARLIYVEHRDGHGDAPLFYVPFDPNSVFEEVILDPRLHPEDVRDRQAELISLGFSHPVNKSDLYQRVLYEFVID
jgi:hypothetical protein